MEAHIVTYLGRKGLDMAHVLGAVVLALFLVQIVRGLALALQFEGGAGSWESVNYAMSAGSTGAPEALHAAVPVLAFGAMYAHISTKLHMSVGMGQGAVMGSGLAILVLSYATAFLGYAMVFGDMGYWATTVIFQLLSFVPGLVERLFGNFTLSVRVVPKLFALHYLTGLLMAALAAVRILALHTAGSLNRHSGGKGGAFPDVLLKDTAVLAVAFLVVGGAFLLYTGMLVEGGNDTLPNPRATPAHITPESYLLVAYGTLKRPVSKAVGILAAAILLHMVLGPLGGSRALLH